MTQEPARVTFLGTGTSHGVPTIGCECATCRSEDPRDKRLRTSIFVDVPGHARILVDCSPDLRQQALTHGITSLDAVLFTHGHADHVMGLDDIRAFNRLQRTSIPAFASAETWRDLRQTFHYIFAPVKEEGGGVPRLDAVTIDGPFDVGQVRIVPVPVWHGSMSVLGFRFGGFAYLTDCNRVPDESMALLGGLDVLVIDALRQKPHSTHFSVDQALAVSRMLAPTRTFFTHISHQLQHAPVSATLPRGVELAYDGLALDVAVDVSPAAIS